MKNYFQICSLIAAAWLCTVGHSQAEDSYPSRPVHFIVSYSPGGATDIITRIMAEKMQADLGQSFPVENRTGAGGNVGAEYVANSTPDGYAIFMGSPGPLVTNPFLYASTPFDPAKAFAPVILVARLPNVLVVHPSLGVKTTRELIAKGKQSPGSINYASGGTGSAGQLSMELFKAMAGVDFSHIPYKGTGQAVQDVLAGRVPILFDNVTPLLSYIRAGNLLPLGVSTKASIASLPGVPPVADTVPNFESSSWVAIVAPAKTPAPILDRLNASANRVLKNPAVVQQLQSLGATPAGGSAEELKAFLVDETSKWKNVIQVAGIKPEQ